MSCSATKLTSNAEKKNKLVEAEIFKLQARYSTAHAIEETVLWLIVARLNSNEELKQEAHKLKNTEVCYMHYNCSY